MTAARLWLAAMALGAVTTVGAAPDALRGEQIYVRCMACHALASDRVGPRHCGLLGRRAGSVAGFAYSPAMKNSKLVWDEKTLDLFLQAPTQRVPGTAMTYDGVADPQQRQDLIAYLKKAGQSQASRLEWAQACEALRRCPV